MPQSMSRTGFLLHGLVIGAVTAAAGCSSGLHPAADGRGGYRGSGGGAAGYFAGTTAEHAREHTRRSDAADALAESLDALGNDVQTYYTHVTTLGNPYFEGRAPGSRGVELAAAYVQQHFEAAGLTPAFSETIDTPDGEVVTPNSSYRQLFTVPGKTSIEVAEAGFGEGSGSVSFEMGEDFNPLGLGSNGEVSAPLVFVGYSIENGLHGFSSYGEEDDLKGRIAVVLRFEPMNEEGKSQWSEDDGWSRHAALVPKVQAAAARGADAVILVNAPGAADDRAGALLDLSRSNFGRPVGVPVIMLDTELADKMVRAADPSGRSLMDLRRLADEGEGGAINLGEDVFTMEVETHRNSIATDNVGGVLRGRGSLADEYVVIGAHYDHVGYGRYGSRSPDSLGTVHPGADDNASGTTGVIMAAQWLSDIYSLMPEDAEARSVLFLAFSAEEMGLLGSRAYVAEPSVPLEDVNIMMNMDMIGRYDTHVEVNGVGTADGLLESIQPMLDATGLTITTGKSGQAPSDQAVFVEQDIPVLGFFTGTHEDYHRVTDHAWKIDPDAAVRISWLVTDIAMKFATSEERLAYVSVDGPRNMGGVARAKVRLGISPANYNDDEPGVAVGGVYEGTSAWKGGMKKGDRIIRWGGEELAGVMSMMEHLAAHEPGDRVTLIVIRDGKEMTLNLIMQGRKRGQ